MHLSMWSLRESSGVGHRYCVVKVGSIRALLVFFFRVVLCAHNLFVEAFFLLSELTNSECRNQDSHAKEARTFRCDIL